VKTIAHHSIQMHLGEAGKHFDSSKYMYIYFLLILDSKFPGIRGAQMSEYRVWQKKVE